MYKAGIDDFSAERDLMRFNEVDCIGASGHSVFGSGFGETLCTTG